MQNTEEVLDDNNYNPIPNREEIPSSEIILNEQNDNNQIDLINQNQENNQENIQIQNQEQNNQEEFLNPNIDDNNCYDYICY